MQTCEEIDVAIELYLDKKHDKFAECLADLQRAHEGSPSSFYRWLSRTWKMFAEQFERAAKSVSRNQRRRLLEKAEMLREGAIKFAEMASTPPRRLHVAPCR